ncbi:hypothetical protein HNO88_002960 [Novosphingobium chloroacetimidivorans]|uniref:Uncharacterized protein n=1 Tax=Novosphingobium chloroacetimidivorans TaxID=1428314 RepID=A0A7W7KBB5_9SPHN|nr:hypothetical protein [Novosphingobium chloroacetimidivorans]MBB4859631.1 hypothetical protein [Novosphingobium chloroacetimidivorans]
MSTYPLEAGEAEPFVPASLRDLPDLPHPPTFFLRWGTPREKERMRRILDEEGCTLYSEEAMRAEILRGMKDLFSAEDFATWEPAVKAWWDANDQFTAQNAKLPVDEREEWFYEGEQLIVEVQEQIARDWRPYRLMNADNNAYRRTQGHAINAVVIERYENLDAPIKKAGRYLDYNCAVLIIEALDKLSAKHAPDAPVRASSELGIECLKRLFLDRDAEKNSVSPAPSDKTPLSSKTGAASTSGKSRASARSKKTREASSANASSV